MFKTLSKRPAPGLFLLPSLLLAGTVYASESNKWRLEFSGGADSDGTIVIRIAPHGGEDVLIKKRHGAASFGVSVVSNDVKGERINLDKEQAIQRQAAQQRAMVKLTPAV